MHSLDDSSPENFYQFPCWSTSITRSHTTISNRNVKHGVRFCIDNRNQSRALSKKNLSQYDPDNLTPPRLLSPPLLHQPTPTPDLCSIVDQFSSVSSSNLYHYPKPIRVKSATLTISKSPYSIEATLQQFPKQTHERRKVMQERKRQKQLTQKYVEADTDTWHELRESLAKLKRLAASEAILVDPSTSMFNCDGYSFEALRSRMNQQGVTNKSHTFKTESVSFINENMENHNDPPLGENDSSISSSSNSTYSSRVHLTTLRTSAQGPVPRFRLARRATETYAHSSFEPLIVAAKPIHSLVSHTNSLTPTTKPKHTKLPSSAPVRERPPSSFALASSTNKNPDQSLISDISNYDGSPISSTSASHLSEIKEEKTPRQEVSGLHDHPKRLGNGALKSKIKLESRPSRCRSAMEVKGSLPLNKDYPRFILITDQEHQIESWYHQYPFITSDDLLQSFESSLSKSTTLGYFIDDYQELLDLHKTSKAYLQGKPFRVNNDWSKYDLIFISNNIYHQIIIYLQTIINLLIKSSGKVIHIYQINHNEDLKTQIRYICKQLNQQILFHI